LARRRAVVAHSDRTQRVRVSSRSRNGHGEGGFGGRRFVQAETGGARTECQEVVAGSPPEQNGVMQGLRRIMDDQSHAHFVTFSVLRRRRVVDYDPPQRVLFQGPRAAGTGGAGNGVEVEFSSLGLSLLLPRSIAWIISDGSWLAYCWEAG
jgi:hypothetical protein